ncbi:unnamed protein product [Rotaria magnacalcarata]|uniref:Calponin-homology (CH) domain-containing protein n=3 Tax=Rotaria magnacalcarata TaxID=392030 RepID=A0A816YXE2_9BILA|nr:unnamed protein product [Rotaria magnacalcarata]CAF2179017.1 unnamed protein product [Rotaria magnacalcarata]
MSHTNTNVRSIRDQFQQQHPQVNQYGNISNHRYEQKHDILFQCIHCGRHQTVCLIFQPNATKDIVPSQGFQYDSPQYSPQTINEENKFLPTARQVSTISEKQQQEEEEEEKTPLPPLHRSNYALDLRRLDDENNSKKVIEKNMKGFVDGCVRSSLNEISYANTEGETKDIIEVEVEYDPILGNVKSTRKRSSTIVTNLDNDYRPMNHRYQLNNNNNNNNNSRYRTVSSDTERDNNTPIWARRRVSHSIVKPSDLIRENDKKEKLQATALRRLSRADLAGDNVVPNSTVRPQTSSQNPTKIKDTILRWCQDLTQYYKGVNIQNFSSSWNDGLAFCAIIHRHFPDEFSFDTLSADDPRQNFDLAFTVAYERAGIEPLIDTDDMILMGPKPDWKVVFTYVQSLYRHLSRIQPPAVMRQRW